MKTVLMLEDESGVMEFLRDMLKQYTVIEATTAEQALRLFRDHGPNVDLLIADLSLPKSSGVQVALLLRAEVPDLPVILTSGYPVSDWTGRDYTDLQRLGSTSVALLSKPFQIHELLTMVRVLTGGVPSEIARTA
jgi:DNA-binding response OmpR family regulator